MATTTAGGAVDPLADLDISREQETLDAIEAEHLERREKAAASQERKLPPNRGLAVAPPSPPRPESARWCACSNPWLNPAAPGNCAKCGKALPATPTIPEVNPTGNGREIATAQPLAGVPWTVDQERELAVLVRSRQSTQWAIGDAILAAVPNGATRARNGSGALLAELGRRVGLEAASVRRLRATSAAWPAGTRVAEASWSAHATFIRGGARAAPERARSLRDLADGGRVSADMVRERILRVQRCRQTADPFRSFLNRLDRLHGAAVQLPDKRSRNGHASPAILRRRAEQAREIADRLEALAG